MFARCYGCTAADPSSRHYDHRRVAAEPHFRGVRVCVLLCSHTVRSPSTPTSTTPSSPPRRAREAAGCWSQRSGALDAERKQARRRDAVRPAIGTPAWCGWTREADDGHWSCTQTTQDKTVRCGLQIGALGLALESARMHTACTQLRCAASRGSHSIRRISLFEALQGARRICTPGPWVFRPLGAGWVAHLKAWLGRGRGAGGGGRPARAARR